MKMESYIIINSSKSDQYESVESLLLISGNV